MKVDWEVAFAWLCIVALCMAFWYCIGYITVAILT